MATQIQKLSKEAFSELLWWLDVSQGPKTSHQESVSPPNSAPGPLKDSLATSCVPVVSNEDNQENFSSDKVVDYEAPQAQQTKDELENFSIDNGPSNSRVKGLRFIGALCIGVAAAIVCGFLSLPPKSPNTSTIENLPNITEANSPLAAPILDDIFKDIVNGNYESAEALLNKVRAMPISAGQLGQAWLLDGNLQRRQGRFKASMGCFARAHELYSQKKGTQAHQMMALAESAKSETFYGYPNMAIKTLQGAFIPSVTNHSAVQTWFVAKAHAQITLGQYDGALKTSQKRLTLSHPNDHRILSDIAFCYVLTGNLKRAQETMTKVELHRGVPTRSQWAHKILFNIATKRLAGLDFSEDLKVVQEYLEEVPDYQLRHFLKIATEFVPSQPLH